MIILILIFIGSLYLSKLIRYYEYDQKRKEAYTRSLEYRLWKKE